MPEPPQVPNRTAHTTTTRGRKVYTPSRYTETGALAGGTRSGHSIFDYHDEVNSIDSDYTAFTLYEDPTWPQVEYIYVPSPYGITTSAKTHVQCMEKLDAAIKQAAAHSAAPLLELTLVGATGNQFTNTNELQVLTYWKAMASPDKAKTNSNAA